MKFSKCEKEKSDKTLEFIKLSKKSQKKSLKIEFHK